MFRNIVLMSTTCLACLFAGEGISRLVLDPIDFLWVSVEDDPILFFKPGEGKSGHDDWGFRNKDVPQKADVLALGDSMTYGVMAKSVNSWPAHLGKLSDQTVYNAGLNGYGPIQYWHIMQERAPDLAPDEIVVMIYMGNDFVNAYNVTYALDHWADYRRPGNLDKVDFEPVKNDAEGRPLSGVRDWLAANSVIYRLATTNSGMDGLRMREREGGEDPYIIFNHRDRDILLSQRSKNGIDYKDKKVMEGMEISKRILREMKAYCEDRNIKLRVALMPVKEDVYLSALADEFTSEQHADMKYFTDSLAVLLEQTITFLDEEEISYVDLKPALEEALKTTDIYPPTDGHPNGVGYEVSAKAMLEAFRTKTAKTKQ